MYERRNGFVVYRTHGWSFSTWDTFAPRTLTLLLDRSNGKVLQTRVNDFCSLTDYINWLIEN